MEERNTLTSLHTSGSLQSHLDCSLCTLVHHFRFSIMYLVSTLSHRLCLNEIDSPKARENQRLCANKGDTDANNTYFCLFGRAATEERVDFAKEWRDRYGLSAK